LMALDRTEVHTRMNENPRSHKGFRGFSFSVTANSYAMATPIRLNAVACKGVGRVVRV